VGKRRLGGTVTTGRIVCIYRFFVGICLTLGTRKDAPWSSSQGHGISPIVMQPMIHFTLEYDIFNYLFTFFLLIFIFI